MAGTASLSLLAIIEILPDLRALHVHATSLR